jgi:uridine kinase
MTNSLPIPVEPRQTVQARFPDGRAFEAANGTPIEAFVNAANLKGNGRVVAVLLDGKLRELTIPLHRDAFLEPVTMADSDGMRIYRRSLCFLMVVAAAKVFPELTITIMHSMPFGGYYCEFDQKSATESDMAALKKQIQGLVAADLPLNQVQVPLEEALQLFREGGDEDKATLFAKRRKAYLTLYVRQHRQRQWLPGEAADRQSGCGVVIAEACATRRTLDRRARCRPYHAR